MEDLVARRKHLKGKLTRLKNKIEDGTIEWEVSTVTLYEEQIDDVRVEFDNLYDDILKICPEEEEDDHQQQYNVSADRIDEVKLAIQQIMRNLVGQQQTSQNNRNRRLSRETVTKELNVKLPKFDIPTFSGNILDWTLFCDLFSSSVHNNAALGEAQKLQYLKSLVRGDAEQLLASYQISDANYKEAWGTLKKRYQNTRELIRSQLIRFIEMPTLRMESAVDLRKLVDTASSVARALRAL
ncbi:unnamed protein product, partial [Allacma fusca]